MPHLGGVERYAQCLAKALVNSGNRVIVVTSKYENEPTKDIIEGVEILRTDSFFLMGDRLPIYKYDSSNSKIVEYLKNQSIDRIIINTKLYTLSYMAVRFAGKYRIPTIIIEHGTGHIEFSNRFVTKIGEIYEHVLTRLIKSHCRNFVGVSGDCCIWLNHFGIKALGVLYNSIDPEEIENILDDNRSIRDQQTIVYSGRVIREKGVNNLISAFVKIENDFPGSKLIIIGDGNELDNLIKTYGDDTRIEFKGRKPYYEAIRELGSGGIFCMPTYYPEGLPTCVLEAMSAGLYIITTQAGGLKELVIDGSYGSILPYGSEDEVIKELRRVLSMDPEQFGRIARNGKERVNSIFTWNNTVKELECIMREIDNGH